MKKIETVSDISKLKLITQLEYISFLETEFLSRMQSIILVLEMIEKIENKSSPGNLNPDILAIQKPLIYLSLYNIIEYSITESIKVIIDDFRKYSIEKFSDQYQSVFFHWFCKKNYSSSSKHFLNLIQMGVKNSIRTNPIKFSERILEYGERDLSLKEKFNINGNNSLTKAELKLLYQNGESLKYIIDNRESLNVSQAGLKGNIGTKEIQIISDFFGWKLNFNTEECEALNNIKTRRNKLSHGGDFLIVDPTINSLYLAKLFYNIYQALQKYFKLVDNFLKEKKFLKS